MKHAHAELLHRLADDCKLEVWLWLVASRRWIHSAPSILTQDCNADRCFALGDKPILPPRRYAMVEGVRVPITHLTVAPALSTNFWLVDTNGLVTYGVWVNATADHLKLDAQNVYETYQDAQEAATAWARVRKQASERAA